MKFSAALFFVSLLGSAIAAPQPSEDSAIMKRTPMPSCDTLNGGKLLCCQGTFAGDVPILKTLAGLTAFPLNPNDINCIGVVGAGNPTCSGVNVCCQVTSPTSPLLALYCQKPTGC